MKSCIKLLGIIILVVTIGFSMVACDDINNDDNDYEVIITDGRLTITGLGNYVGKNIWLEALDLIVCKEAGFYNYGSYGATMIRVEGHSVAGKVYKVTVDYNSTYSDAYLSYNGNDQNVEFTVTDRSVSPSKIIGTATTSFTNGIGSAVFQPSSD